VDAGGDHGLFVGSVHGDDLKTKHARRGLGDSYSDGGSIPPASTIFRLVLKGFMTAEGSLAQFLPN